MGSSVRFSVALFAASLLTGCSSSYVVSVRDSGTEQPLADTQVTISSNPRIYSFLDPRHYLIGCGNIAKAHGTTDSNGQVKLTLPQDRDIWRATANDSWTVPRPPNRWNGWKEWTVMLSLGEEMSGINSSDIAGELGRPEIKVVRE